MKQSIKFFIFLLIFIFNFGNHLFSQNIYVKTTGNDNNSGLTLALAKKTIQSALNIVTPGYSVLVSAGTYKERLVWPNSGASGSYITLTNYNGGIVYVDGSTGGTNSSADALLTISDKSWIKIENIRFRKNYRNNAGGIVIIGAGRDLQLKNLQLFEIGWTTSTTTVPNSNQNATPVLVRGSKTDSLRNIIIEGCTIYKCIPGYSEVLAINGNVTDFQIRSNTIYECTNIGIDLIGNEVWEGASNAPTALNMARRGIIKQNTVYKCVSAVAESPGIYVDGGKDIVIEQNKSWGNGSGVSIGCEADGKTVSNVIVRNNWIYSNRGPGARLGSNQPNSKVINTKFMNNTFYKNSTMETWGAEIALQNGQSNLIKQNIFVPRTNQCVAVGIWDYEQTGLSIGWNLYWRTTGGTANMLEDVPADPFSIVGDPKFVSTSSSTAPDLHIKTGSKAIQAGDPAFVAASGELDYDLAARIQQGRVDVGADETNLTAFNDNPDEIVERNEVNSIDLFEVFPNPVSSMFTINGLQTNQGDNGNRLFW